MQYSLLYTVSAVLSIVFPKNAGKRADQGEKTALLQALSREARRGGATFVFSGKIKATPLILAGLI